MTAHAWRDAARGRRQIEQRCVACSIPARCPHDDVSLRWVDDQWYCSRCGDEWPDDSFGDCQSERKGS